MHWDLVSMHFGDFGVVDSSSGKTRAGAGSSESSSSDKSVVELLYRKYQKLLIAFLMKQHSADRELAQEIAQETFISLSQHLERGGSLDNEKALIIKIAKNKLIDYHRRSVNASSTVHVPVEDTHLVSPLTNQEQLLMQHQQLDVLEQVILNLPERCQEVFVLRVFEEMKHEEIAKACGISRSMVEKHLVKAFKRVRQETGLC